MRRVSRVAGFVKNQHHSKAVGAQKDLLKCQIEKTDGEIDSLVYKLYRLTDGDIWIVEQSMQDWIAKCCPSFKALVKLAKDP